MNVFVTGGCGYVGSILVPKLLAKGHVVTVCDTLWFGNYLLPHPNLTVQVQDIRKLKALPTNTEAIIHLASVADDASSELNPLTTWEVGVFGTINILNAALHSACAIIHASSGSIYGVRSEDQVTEELKLEPFSYYNKVKMVVEQLVASSTYVKHIIRPAAIHGYSPRMRFEIGFNQLVLQAVTTGRIKVFGGEQLRPMIDIEDITDLYVASLTRVFGRMLYNAVSTNISILELAKTIQKVIDCEIDIVPSNDVRSYHMNGDRLKSAGFLMKQNLIDSIRNLASKIKEHNIKDDDKYYNIRWMKKNAIK